uniref:Gfo/Idh/MocA family oxidoreductase n=1 Tax=Bacillus sp. DX2.2 TaxID=3073452 RepID=UPI00402A888B
MNIAMVGGGSASHFHLMAYSQLKNKLSFSISFLVEPNKKNAEKWLELHKKLFDNSELPKIYKDIKEVPEFEGMIIDICSPNNTHLEIIKQCKLNGGYEFIVEKPAFINYEELEEFKKLHGVTIYLQENYIYSTVLSKVENLINQYSIIITQIDLDFSKNRIKDSIMERGFYNKIPPHVFMIEIPHTVGIAYHLLGPGEVVYSESEDMSVSNKHYLNHGSGSIIIKHRSAISFHHSSLICRGRKRSLTIKGIDANNNIFSISSHFPNDHKKLLGAIELKMNNVIIEYEEIIDNSLANSIYSILLAFEGKKEVNVNKEFIIQTSKLLFDAIDKSMKLRNISGIKI